MEMPPMPPMPPHDPKYWQAESDYRRDQAKRGGIVSDIAVSLGELVRLMVLLPVVLARPLVRMWSRRRSRNATR